MSVDLYAVILGLVATVLVSFVKQTGFRKEINFVITLVVAIALGVAQVYITTGTFANLGESVAVILATATVAYELIWSKIEASTKLASITSIWKTKEVKKGKKSK